MKPKRSALLLSMLVSFSAVAFASSSISTGPITAALCSVRMIVVQVLPTLALVLFFLAGLAYAAGQVFGAETKARAQNWAMSLIVGGIVGIMLAVMAPIMVGAFVPALSGASVPTC